MMATEKYLREVLNGIQAPPKEMARIEADLRSHLEDLAEEEGPDVSRDSIVERMGPPEEVAAEFMANIRLDYAGFPVRFLAFLVDSAVCFLVVGILFLPAFFIAESSTMEFSGLNVILGLAAFSLIMTGAAVMILYFPLLEGGYGTTLGKHLCNLHVVRENGAPIGYKEAFLRRIPYYFEFMFIDVPFIFFTAKKQRAFDLIARTVVIKHI